MRPQAEFAANTLGKGRLVLVEGRNQVRSYDAQDGQRRKVWEIVSENLRSLDRPKDPAAAEATAAAPALGADGSFDDPFQDE